MAFVSSCAMPNDVNELDDDGFSFRIRPVTSGEKSYIFYYKFLYIEYSESNWWGLAEYDSIADYKVKVDGTDDWVMIEDGIRLSGYLMNSYQKVRITKKNNS